MGKGEAEYDYFSVFEEVDEVLKDRLYSKRGGRSDVDYSGLRGKLGAAFAELDEDQQAKYKEVYEKKWKLLDFFAYLHSANTCVVHYGEEGEDYLWSDMRRLLGDKYSRLDERAKGILEENYENLLELLEIASRNAYSKFKDKVSEVLTAAREGELASKEEPYFMRARMGDWDYYLNTLKDKFSQLTSEDREKKADGFEALELGLKGAKDWYSG